MIRSTVLTLAMAATTCAIGFAYAQESRSYNEKAEIVAAGHDFALKVCAACHVVSQDQKSAPILKPPAPSFSELIRRQGLTEASLRKFLSSPHGNVDRRSKMPNPQLADFQIDKIVAFMLNLKDAR
jgi:mono/diheme cytochrome c family protein